MLYFSILATEWTRGGNRGRIWLGFGSDEYLGCLAARGSFDVELLLVGREMVGWVEWALAAFVVLTSRIACRRR